MRAIFGFAAAGLLCATAPAPAPTKLSDAILADPAMIGATWALAQGKVKPDKVTVEVKPLPLPALIQALATKRYDITVGAVPPVPIALARGIPIKILSSTVRLRSEGVSGDIGVKADSPIKTAKDLKVPATTSSARLMSR
jgi:ABC-type nitrate/sulfonate/bicarbonate transport system substrate-binding protein